MTLPARSLSTSSPQLRLYRADAPLPRRKLDSLDYDPVGEPPARVLPDLRQNRVDVYAWRVNHGFAVWRQDELDTFRLRGFAADLGKEADRLMNGSDDEHERLTVPLGRRLLFERAEYDALGSDEDEWLSPGDPLGGRTEAQAA